MGNYKLEPPEIKAGRDWFTIVFKRPEMSYEKRFYGTGEKLGKKLGKNFEADESRIVFS